MPIDHASHRIWCIVRTMHWSSPENRTSAIRNSGPVVRSNFCVNDASATECRAAVAGRPVKLAEIMHSYFRIDTLPNYLNGSPVHFRETRPQHLMLINYGAESES